MKSKPDKNTKKMHKKIRNLKHGEIAYREIIEGISDITLVTDKKGRFTYVSPSVQNYLGYVPSELIGRKSSDFTHPDDAAKARKRSLDLVHETLPPTEYRIRSKTGEYRWFRSVNKLLVEDSDVIGRYGILNDITDQKKAEIRLRENEFKYKNIFSNLLDVYVETDMDGTVLELSPSIESLLGYTREALLGKKAVMHYVNPEERDKHVNKVKTMGRTSNFHIELYHKDGSIVPVSVSSKLTKDLQGQNYIISMLRNETERRKTELMRLEGEKRLRQAQKMESIGTLAGGIAHDFNNILASIIGFTELALDEVDRGTILDDSLQEVYRAGKRARDLVKQILAFARQSDEKLRPLEPTLIAKEVLKFLRSTIPTTIEIQQHIESHSLILGNATQVHQVLMNLCTNAAHAMEKEGGILNVSLTDVTSGSVAKSTAPNIMKGEYIELKVSDNGTGIASENIATLFEPYYTTKAPGEGTGMGLAMVQGIVESYGGHIFVDSELGKGSNFTIYLPITRKRGKTRLFEKEEWPGGSEAILFIDDEAPIVKVGRRMLERLGYRVTTLTSSLEALELIRSKPEAFDLVITDMTMPNMRGDQLAIELLKIQPDIPIIICTGYSSRLSEADAHAIGIKAFAYKPIVKADLAKTVRKVLDESNA